MLKEFQVDTVKLEGSLVKDIVDNSSSRDVASSILSLAEKGRRRTANAPRLLKDQSGLPKG